MTKKTKVVNALLVPADITAEPRELEVDMSNWHQLYKLVDCSLLEPLEAGGVTFWCDEEAGPGSPKPTNARVTMMLRGMVYMSPEGIKGNIVITGPGRNAVSVPPDWAGRHRAFLAPGVGVPGGGFVAVSWE